MAATSRSEPGGVKFGVELDIQQHGWPAWAFALVLGGSVAAVWASLQSIAAMTRVHAGDDAAAGIPASLEELKATQHALAAAVEHNFAAMAAAFAVVYLFKQTYAIPGSAILNLIAGAVFGTAVGLLMVCLLTACGASCCYLLSWRFGGRLVRCLGSRVRPVTVRVDAARAQGTLFYYLLFARLFPFTPNWALNLVAPWVGVPLQQFWPSVLLGLLPYNFVLVRAGTLIEQLSSTSDAMDWTTLAQLAALAALALLPTALSGRAKQLERWSTGDDVERTGSRAGRRSRGGGGSPGAGAKDQ